MREEQSRTHPVPEDMPFQYAFWTAERVAWIILALVPLVALSGIFAHGVVSETTAGAAGSPLTMQYERFQRETALSKFVAHVSPANSGEVRLRLGPSFQRVFEIESIQPQPARSIANASGLEFFFHPPTADEFTAVIWTRPREFGVIPVEAEGGSGGALKFSILVYP
jgi:hypothetical protein